MGYALQTCSQSIYGARHAGLKVGIPQEVPMLTLSRICGSGIQSIVSGAQMIMLGEAKTVVSGGMENLSQAPHILRGARDGWKLGRSPKVEDYMMTNLQDMTCGLFMAQASDELCRRKGVTFVRKLTPLQPSLTHEQLLQLTTMCSSEIVAVTIKSRRGGTVLTHKGEDHVIRGTTIESLSGLPAAFGPESFVTAGNASGVVDGAAAVDIKSTSQAKPTAMHRLHASFLGVLSGLGPPSWPTALYPPLCRRLSEQG